MSNGRGVSRREFLTGVFRNQETVPGDNGCEESLLASSTAPQEPDWSKNMERAMESMNDLSGILEP
jgi:hypothetical protein